MVISVITFLLSSCTVAKRVHRNGYYVNWNKKSVAITAKKQNADYLQVLNKESAGLTNREINKTISASAKVPIKLKVKSIPTKQLPTLLDSCGDIIILRNGEEITVKALEISQQTIKYKRCNNLDGPLISVNTENVFMIKYANGFKEVFKEKPVAVNIVETKKAPEKKYNNLAIASFVIALFLFFPYGAPFAFGFGIQALREMKKEPEKYKGKAMAVTGVVISSVVLLIALVVLLSFLL